MKKGFKGFMKGRRGMDTQGGILFGISIAAIFGSKMVSDGTIEAVLIIIGAIALILCYARVFAPADKDNNLKK